MARDDQPRARLARPLDGDGGAAGGRPPLHRAEGGALSDDELRRRGEEWAEAIALGDRAAAEEILGDDFVLSSVGGVGGDVPRGRWLELLDELETRAFTQEDVTPRLFGDVAVVRSVVRWDASLGGRDLSGAYVTDVFTRSEDVWRAAWRISVHVPDDAR